MLKIMNQPQRGTQLEELTDDPVTVNALKGRARRASDVLKALAHESRMLILGLVAARERSVSELETLLALRQPAVSQQLARLRVDGLVKTRREGKIIFYSLASEDVRQMVEGLYDLFCDNVDECDGGAGIKPVAH